jgi:mandelate racemase
VAEDYAGHAAVAREAHTPIQAGENWWGPRELGKALDAHASDYAMLDAMKIGGVTGWMEGAALAAARGVRISSHLWPELSAQLLCASATAHWLEYADWWNPVVKEPLRIDQGDAVASALPGSGVEWDEKAIARFSA